MKDEIDTKQKLSTEFIKKDHSGISKRIEVYDTVVNGMVLRITKTGYKSFAFRYWYDGQSRQITIGRADEVSLADARKKAREYKDLVRDGKDPLLQRQAERETRPQTWKQVVEAYKARHLPTLKQSTRTDYESRIKHLLKGEGARKTKSRGFDGKRPIKNMKRHQILDYLEEIASTSPVQAQRIQAILSGIFKFAKDREWVDVNIASDINLTGKRQKRQDKWSNTDYTDQELKALWAEFEGSVAGYYFKMLLVTGQRAGETRLMKWSDIDLNKQLWTIPETDTKNGLTHYVPLSQTVIELLEGLKSWAGGGKYVFESDLKPGHPIGSQQKAAQRIRERSGIDFNIHSLRTTAATRLAGLGTPPQVLSKILNHKKPGEGSVITAIYNKYDYEDEKRRAMDRWANKLEQILSGEAAKIHKIS